MHVWWHYSILGLTNPFPSLSFSSSHWALQWFLFYCLLARGQIFVALSWLIWFGERILLKTFCLDHTKAVLEGSKTSSFEIHWGYNLCVRHDVYHLFGRTLKSALVTKPWKPCFVSTSLRAGSGEGGKRQKWGWAGAGKLGVGLGMVKKVWAWGRKTKRQGLGGWDEERWSWEKARQEGGQTWLSGWRNQGSHETKARRMEVGGLVESTSGAGRWRAGNRLGMRRLGTAQEEQQGSGSGKQRGCEAARPVRRRPGGQEGWEGSENPAEYATGWGAKGKEEARSGFCWSV